MKFWFVAQDGNVIDEDEKIICLPKEYKKDIVQAWNEYVESKTGKKLVQPTEVNKYMLWITSNRGTDEQEIVEFPIDYEDEDVKDWMESEWCPRFAAWTHGENVVHYGVISMDEFVDTEITVVDVSKGKTTGYKYEVTLSIPGCTLDMFIDYPTSRIPWEMHDKLEKGCKFRAKTVIGAENIHELRMYDIREIV